MMAAVSGQEKQYYDQLFAAVDSDGTGVLPGKDALPFLTSSGLPQQSLGEIWAIADPDNNGFITKDGWYKAARIIGWLQNGSQSQVDIGLASKPGPLPTFSGYPAPPVQASRLSLDNATTLPPLTPADRTKFTRYFVGCGPTNGFVSGDKAKEVFLKSQLSYDKLGQIWNLTDTQERGALDLTDFIIGMYLIQSCMANPNLVLPTSLPPGTYEAASGGRSAPNASTGSRPGATSPIQRQLTGQLTGTLQPQMTGQSFVGPTPTPPRSATMTPPTRQSTKASFTTAPTDASIAWDVSADAKATSDRFFTQLDTQNKGVIEGDVAVPFMLQSQLDEGSLASIWDLADIRQEGKLDRDEFAVAMFLINSKLSGKDLPAALPPSLIPPALRSQFTHSAPQVSSTSKDLFDLFGEDAAMSTSAPATAAAFLPQPPSRRGTTETSRQVSAASQRGQGGFVPMPAGDLLGDDGNEAQASFALSQSAEVGNKKNQLENTKRSLTDLEKSREELTESTTSSASQLATLDAELAAARSKHETETKAVSELRIRVGEQATKLKQLQAEVIAAESDLTATRMEKDELEQALLRDKEEVRGLQRRMKELEDEKTGLQLLLDKVRKEARQQKGRVTIAKKQVSTAEASRDGVQREIHDVEATAEAGSHDPVGEEFSSTAPVTSSTRALSPEVTGTSQRSTNPFDRFTRSQSPGSERQHSAGFAATGLVAGSAAGALATGLAFEANAATGHESHQDDVPTALEDTGQHLNHVARQDDSQVTETDPFGAPVLSQSDESRPAALPEDDPFGGPYSASSPTEVQGQSGFGDSFVDQDSAMAVPQSVDTSAKAPPTDFDAAFADFDASVNPSDVPQTGEVANREAQTAGAQISLNPHSPFHNDLRPEAERTVSTQAIAPSSAPDTPVAEQHEAVPKFPSAPEDESSDDNEGPEDLEGPVRSYSRPLSPANVEDVPIAASIPAATAVSTPAEENHRVRRTAPPPPVARSHTSASVSPTPAADAGALGAPTVSPMANTEQNGTPGTLLDPFGAPQAPGTQEQATSPIGAPPAAVTTSELDPFGAPTFATGINHHGPSVVPKTAQFDEDDDFDFSDLPPNKQSSSHHIAPVSSAFDDEFANFDDDFDKPPSQVNTSSDKSYEVVSAPGAQGAQDEWGMSQTQPAAPEVPTAGTLSFDDAFGGEFGPPQVVSTAPLAAGQAPRLPERPDLPQADDLEDVKKLCAMGFPRSLVVEALDANGYNFQKALNVLLDK